MCISIHVHVVSPNHLTSSQFMEVNVSVATKSGI